MKTLCVLKTVCGLLLMLILSVGCNVSDQPAAPKNAINEPIDFLLKPDKCVKAPSGLVSWWPGDGNALDIVSGNNGTLQNGATFAPSMVGQAFSFDGVDDVVQVPNGASLNFGANSPITVDLWAYRTGPIPRMHFFGKRELDCGALNYQMVLNMESGEGLAFGAGAGVSQVETGMDLPMATWTHLAGTFDGATYSFYINGQLVATSNGSGFLGPINTAPFQIGGSGNCETFGGYIDEVEIFNRALSAQEIQSIYNAGSAGKCKTGIKVTICHKPGTPAQKTMVIPVQALAGHLGHGDTIGPCD